MFTIKSITNGSSYAERHLKQNDYYSEGETVTGIWHGKGAEQLRLQGDVRQEALEALRINRHPETGKKLTPRDGKSRNAFYDVTLSAPKSVSIIAVVGEDEKVREAFHAAAETAISALEKHATVRERRGENVRTNNVRTTGNFVAAAFTHDASRELDPQLHTHVLVANATYDQERQAWYALQTKPMMQESTLIARRFREDLVERLKALGYQASLVGGDLRIQGISASMEIQFSQRTQQRLKFESHYRQAFGAEPSKKRIEHFIKDGRSAATKRFQGEYFEAFGNAPSQSEVQTFVQDWRDPKLKEIATTDVRRLQRSRLTSSQLGDLKEVVQHAHEGMAHDHEALKAPSNKVASSIDIDDLAQNWHTKSRSKLQRQPKPPRHHSVPTHPRLARAEAIRRLRRGLSIQAAFRGNPQGLVVGGIRRKAMRSTR